ncbi:LTA synthase family protein [Halovivax limisalsi]|uniref:LTA synthase family protein n=1 Tax=Halovivax limisalsi TaxID=1453760 RepID=UPI001FFDA4DB|nr:LTA synthase family protein [Halovivax limisalsi]
MTPAQLKTGIRHPDRALRFLKNRVGSRLLRWSFDDNGVHVLDEQWDTLIILDCGRYDVFAELVTAGDAPVEVDGELGNVRSLASVTNNFVKRNFRDRRAHDLVYLSANPAVASQAEYLDIHKLVGMWHDTPEEKRGQENRRALTDPRPVVERALELHDEYPNKRHVVHLLPPHVPHLFKDGERLPEESPYRNYEAARAGDVEASEMRRVYAENYRYALQEIAPLVSELEGKIVVTADHGELLGEGMPRWMKFFHTRWGDRWEKYDFGHYDNVDVPGLVEVPWLEVPFDDRREVVAEPPTTDEYDTESIEDTLTALGYRT